MTKALPRPHQIAAMAGLMISGLSASAQVQAPASAASAPAPAVAPPEPNAASVTPPSDPAKLDAVTVTAERRVENIKNVPVSISVLRGEALDAINSSGETIIALASRVPSVNAETSAGRSFPRFYIRGYGNTDFQVNSSQPVSLVYDDVVQENAYLKGFPVFDLNQVEVLRGPQGTLFGRNSPAGVIKFDSAKPTRKFEGYGSLSYGSFGTSNLEGAVNTPINEDWAARVSFLNQHRDNWVHNTYAAGPTQDFEGYDDRAARAQLLYAPSKDFSALFNVHARDMKGSQRLFRANLIKPGTNDMVDGFDPSAIAIDATNQSTLQSHGGSMRLRLALGDYAVHSITGYEALKTFARGDIDGGIDRSETSNSANPSITPFASETSAEVPSHRQLSQELRIESLYNGPLNWQAGLYVFDENYTFVNNDYNSPAGGSLIDSVRYRQKTQAAAAFGSASYQVTPSFKLQAGLRYTRDKKSFDTESVEGVTLTGPLTAAPRDNKLSWDFSGTHALTPDATLYARAASAYRGTSIQPPSALAQLSVARPETNTSIEAGLKADLLDHSARVSLAFFNYEVKNQQLTVIGGNGNANTLINSRKTKGRGFELDLQAFLTEGLMVTAGASYNQTRIDDPGLLVSACGNGCTVTNPIVTPANPAVGAFAPIVSINGNPLPQAPKWAANVTAKYTIATPEGEWYVYTDWAYRSKMNLFLYEAVEFTAKSSLEGGLRVGYVWGNGKYEVAAFARNITNQTRITGAVDFNNLTGFVTDPRTFGAQARVTF